MSVTLFSHYFSLPLIRRSATRVLFVRLSVSLCHSVFSFIFLSLSHSQIYNATRFKVDMAQFPTLVKIQSACEQLEAFKVSHPNVQPDCPEDQRADDKVNKF